MMGFLAGWLAGWLAGPGMITFPGLFDDPGVLSPGPASRLWLLIRGPAPSVDACRNVDVRHLLIASQRKGIGTREYRILRH